MSPEYAGLQRMPLTMTVDARSRPYKSNDMLLCYGKRKRLVGGEALRQSLIIWQVLSTSFHEALFTL